ARAIDLATEVLPTPGGPTKSRMGPLAPLSSALPGRSFGSAGSASGSAGLGFPASAEPETAALEEPPVAGAVAKASASGPAAALGLAGVDASAPASDSASVL